MRGTCGGPSGPPFCLGSEAAYGRNRESDDVIRGRISDRPHGDRHRNHADQRRYRPVATHPAVIRAAVVRASGAARLSRLETAGGGGRAGYGQGIAFVGTGGDGIPPTRIADRSTRERRTPRPSQPSAYLSDNRLIRSIQRWVYRVAEGENPEEADYLKDFPIEADVFPKVKSR